MAANKWFKMGEELMQSKIIYKIYQPQSTRDTAVARRFRCIIELFVASASEISFFDVNQLSKRINVSLKQCQIVWDICIEEGVLRETKQGWNAYDWLLEEGFIGDWKSKRVTPPPPPREAFSNKKEESLFDNF